MIEIDGRDSAKCQKSKLGDIDGIMRIVLNDNKTKYPIVPSPTIEKGKRKRERDERDAVAMDFWFLERE